MRWDHDFTCPFCLVHEVDHRLGGAARSGLFTVEHHVLRSCEEGQGLANDYGNCIYACRECNGARHTQPHVHADGRRLLHPSQDAWATHFELHDDKILPKAGDADAAYTSQAYRPNTKSKVSFRRARREAVEEAGATLEQYPLYIDKVLREVRRLGAAESSAEQVARLQEWIDLARELHRLRYKALKTLRRLGGLPEDHDRVCLCGLYPPELGGGYARQWVDLPWLDEATPSP